MNREDSSPHDAPRVPRTPGPELARRPLDELLGSLEGALHRLADPAAPLEQAVADYQQARALLAAAEARLEAARRRAAALDPGRD